MRFPRPKGPPSTSNAEAQILIDVAKDRCEGCRLSWRLRKGSFIRDEPSPGPCNAKKQRQQLRDIAARSRGK